jgi:peptide/nickel transport system ATP-binding protein
MPENGTLVEVCALQKRFPVESGPFRRAGSYIHAVDGVTFQIRRGQSLALVGESGCGKTTTGKLLARLIEPSAGHITLYDAEQGAVDLAGLKGRQLKTFRRKVQIIFQDPYESLNPSHTVFDIISEPLKVQQLGSLEEREELVTAFLQRVGLTPPESFLFRYPHELSGGQRQRVAIARALVVEPVFIVADEPTSMLDVSIRIGVMQLMIRLAEYMNVSYLYITHDLAVARYMCQEIAVMYLGKIVEQAETEEIIAHPLHPYTKALFSAVPIPNPRRNRKSMEIKGGLAAPIDPPPHCRFLDRCMLADRECLESPHPILRDAGLGHHVACHKISSVSI